MTKNMNNLFKMSLFIRNLALISNRSSPVRLFRTVVACNRYQEQQNETKYPPATKYYAPAEKTFKLIPSKLQNCKNCVDLFDVIREHHQQMNGSEVVRALTIIFNIVKDDHTSSSKNISQKKEFSMLCNVLKNRMGQLSDNEVIQALKVMTFLNVPTSSVIVQMLLQMVRQTMNNLSVQQILFLDFLLKKCQNGPLVNALSMALPIVLSANIKTMIVNEDISTMIKVLKYFMVSDMPKDYEKISMVMKAIINSDLSTMTKNDALEIFSFMIKHRLTAESKILLPEVQKSLINYADELNEQEIIRIIDEITMTSKSSMTQFYHEGLIDALAMTIMTRDLGFQTALAFLRYLPKITHTNTSLLDYIAAKGFENPTLIQKADESLNNAFTILAAMSAADYKPVFWDTIKESLLSPQLLRLSPKLQVNTAIYLASLDCFWPELLKEVFQAPPNPKTMKKITLLYHATKLMFPEYNGPWPSDKIIQPLIDNNIPHKINETLKTALESALGGSQYILSNLITDTNYYVEHVVILRKGGFPIAVNANNENESIKMLRDIKSHEDSQVIIFMLIPRFGCSINTQRLTGFWSLLQKVLKIQTNYTIIPISSTMWHGFNEAEQLRYISQAIRLKCDEISVDASP